MGSSLGQARQRVRHPAPLRRADRTTVVVYPGGEEKRQRFAEVMPRQLLPLEADGHPHTCVECSTELEIREGPPHGRILIAPRKRRG